LDIITAGAIAVLFTVIVVSMLIYSMSAPCGLQTLSTENVLCLLQKKLRSESLRKDAITSGAVAVLSAAILVSTLINSVDASLWWFDSVVALAISLALCCAGTWSLVSTKWWSKSFWAHTPDPSIFLQRSECNLL